MSDDSSEENINFTINICLHVLILFTFLTIFFFMYISELTEKTINNEISNMLKKQTSTTLDKLSFQFNKFKSSDINNTSWGLNKQNLNSFAEQLYTDSNKKQNFIETNHKNLKLYSLIVIIIICFIFVSLILYYKIFTKVNINLREIFIENACIFAGAGFIEYLFFTQVASQYIPVSPDLITKSVFDEIENNVNKVLLK